MNSRLIALAILLFAIPRFAAEAQQSPPQPPAAAAEPALGVGTALPVPARPESEPVPVYAPRPGVHPREALKTLAVLLNRGGNRRFFGLPEDANWRAEEAVRIALYSDYHGEIASFLKAAAAEFAAATGLTVELVATQRLVAVAGAETARQATGANLEVLYGPRANMIQLAGGVAMRPTVLERFRDGRWPFAFVLPREEGWIGRVFIARDEPSEAVDASLALALVWALGGVSLGEEIGRLIDPFAVQPALTPLGHSVFSLMYHPDLEAGLPIAKTLERAERLVSEDRTGAIQSVQ